MKLYLIFTLVLFSGCSSTNVFKGAHIEVQGHRGARSVFPENTLPAFEYALNVGVDTLELDLAVTKDNVLVVYHDQKINSTLCKRKDGQELNDEVWIRELTLKQLKMYDCGSLANPRFPNQRLIPGTEIPTLTEVFEFVENSTAPKAKEVFFNIEMKSQKQHPKAQPSPAQFARLLSHKIKKYGLTQRVVAQSFDHRTLREMKKIHPSLKLSALFEDTPKNWVVATKEAKADIVSPYFLNITKQDVQQIHKAGLKVIPWTANKKREWAYLIKIGVDGIITDDPEPLLKLLGR